MSLSRSLLLALLSPLCAADLPWVNVFTAGEGGVPEFRIPAVVQTDKGTLLAISEARASNADCSYKWLAGKRSVDGGSTWSGIIPIAGYNVTHNSTGNPAVVFDPSTSRIVISYCTSPLNVCNPSAATLVVDDGGSDGLEWGAPRDISSVLGPHAGALPGPGTGVYTSAVSPVPGRIVFAGHWGAYVDDFIWYSDDGGASFTASASALPSMDEVSIAELWDGRLMLNMRTDHSNATCKCRAVSISADAGVTWGPITYDPVLVEPVCQAALVALDGMLFFSNPDSTSQRANITIRRTGVNSTTWLPQTVRVATGPQFGGYTSLVPGELKSAPGMGGILYERTDSTLPPAQQNVIAFSQFTLQF